jgi:hypothetical protein
VAALRFGGGAVDGIFRSGGDGVEDDAPKNRDEVAAWQTVVDALAPQHGLVAVLMASCARGGGSRSYLRWRLCRS